MNDDAWLRIKQPAGDQEWYRGRSSVIKWDVLDPSITTLKISVSCQHWYENGTSTVIGDNIPNTGQCKWERIPWGYPDMDDYFILIEAMDRDQAPIKSGLFSIKTYQP